jgi:hypothetical protein
MVWGDKSYEENKHVLLVCSDFVGVGRVPVDRSILA